MEKQIPSSKPDAKAPKDGELLTLLRQSLERGPRRQVKRTKSELAMPVEETKEERVEIH